MALTGLSAALLVVSTLTGRRNWYLAGAGSVLFVVCVVMIVIETRRRRHAPAPPEQTGPTPDRVSP